MQKLVVVMGVFVAAPVFAQKLAVKIINRQDSNTNYTYVVPGHATANCFAGATTVNCNGTNLPAQQISYHVSGATFSLQLPDGRVAVVNCESKFAEHFAGHQGNRRSCRTPLVDDIQVEFNGDKAKLEWPVSIDGKKIESETYKVLGVLPR